MLGIWAIIKHYQISFVKFARKHSYIIFFRWIACLVIINEQNYWSSSNKTSHRRENVFPGTMALREINLFMEYFFSSEVENTFYSEIEKENLVQFWWAEGTQTQNEIPLFFTRSWEMARFSILQHNFPFSWSICMELSIFSETRLEIRQWMILFLQNSDVRTLYTQTKEV